MSRAVALTMPLRPAASLSAGLLARKGEARPAMPVPLYAVDADEQDSRPLAPPVVRQQQALAVAYATKPRAANGANGRVAFTLRLDAERHGRLRAGVAKRGGSAQALVTEALDRFLAGMGV